MLSIVQFSVQLLLLATVSPLKTSFSLSAFCWPRQVDRRVQERVKEFIGKEDYEFGDISREIENRRRKWVAGETF